MTSHGRQQALFDLCRALSSTLELDEVCRRFDAHATAACGAPARLWLLDGSGDRAVDPGDPAAAIEISPDHRTALESLRPHLIGPAFVVPFVCDGSPGGLIEVAGASSAELASGGMHFWRSLAEVVGDAIGNARRHAEARAEAERLRALVGRRAA